MTSILIAAASAAAEGAAEHAGGLPQMNTATFPSQIFWLVVAMIVLFWMLSRIALPRIGSVLEERANTIATDLDMAEEFKRRAEAAEKAYEQALIDARAKAQIIAAETRAEIQKEVDAAIERADAEIAARAVEGEARIVEIRASAETAVAEVARDTAAAVIDAIMPDVADAGAIDAAVSVRMSRGSVG